MSYKTTIFTVAALILTSATVLAQAATDGSESQVFKAISDFPQFESGDVPYYKDKKNSALAIRANIAEYRKRFAKATRTFNGTSGTYDVKITTLTEEDGESTYRLLINETIVGVFKNDHIGTGSALDMQPTTYVWRSLRINNGDTISIESNAATNGEIPEGDGTAWARGRWRSIELTEAKDANLIQPPTGRLAIVADGNSPDPDDIGATAVMFGLLKASGLGDRLVHLSHSCDLQPTSRISADDEMRRQKVLDQICRDGVSQFGPFKNLKTWFNCRTQQEAAVNDLREAINKSSKTDPLWIIEAGEPDIIGYALKAAKASKRQFVHVVSHHPANDNAGDYFTWQQILDYGVKEHQIGDQNIGLQSKISAWDWAKEHQHAGLRWIWKQLAYAEQDGVVKFQSNKFDCSDAGMVYWWITGADRNGDKHATPFQVAGMLQTLATAPPARPNIIFILADDLGFNQIGAYGDTPIKTPNLDRLASDGVRFTQAYAGNTVCSPSRVSLFTRRDGRLMSNNSNTVQLEQIDVTFAHVLKHAGYDTALFGKYSIGSQMGVTDPLAMGFDTWYGMYAILEGHRQYPHFLWRDGRKLRIEENEAGKKGAYAQELFAQEAIDYIAQDRENPFFVMLAFSSPHAELAAPEKFVKPYTKQFKETPYTGMATGEPADKYAWYYPEPVSRPRATLAGMVTALDEYVGNIVRTLEQRGLADNTLIFFTSDNGPHDEGGADPSFFRAAAPYKGMKRDLFDGGIHVPMIAHWPAAIKRGRVDDTPWAFADVLPTFADLAGVPLTSVPRVKTNGSSIRSLLNDSPQPLPERTLYWEFGKQAGDPNSGIIGEVFQAARRGKWKAVRYGKEAPVQLFNIESDPGETTELSKRHPDIHQEFVSLFEEHKG